MLIQPASIDAIPPAAWPALLPRSSAAKFSKVALPQAL
jgi:hypothetical protein